MITKFPRSGYFRTLETLTDHELHLYALRGEAEAREAEQARERKRVIKQEAYRRLQEAGFGSMTNEELSAYAKRGREEAMIAAAEKLRRWRVSERQAAKVVQFRTDTSDDGGVA